LNSWTVIRIQVNANQPFHYRIIFSYTPTSPCVTWRTRQNNVVFDSAPLAPLCEKSFRKREVHNILHWQWRTEQCKGLHV